MIGACAAVAARGQPAVERIRAGPRASPVVHADDTVWREDGRNGDACTLSTPAARPFGRGVREKAVLDGALGDAHAGVLVSDFCAASPGDEGRHRTAGRTCGATCAIPTSRPSSTAGRPGAAFYRLPPGKCEHWIRHNPTAQAGEPTIVLRDNGGRVVQQWTNLAKPSANPVAWHVFDIDGSNDSVTTINEQIRSDLPDAAHTPNTNVCP